MDFESLWSKRMKSPYRNNQLHEHIFIHRMKRVKIVGFFWAHVHVDTNLLIETWKCNKHTKCFI